MTADFSITNNESRRRQYGFFKVQWPRFLTTQTEWSSLMFWPALEKSKPSNLTDILIIYNLTNTFSGRVGVAQKGI